MITKDMSLRGAILRTAADSKFRTKSITLYKYITPVALAGLLEHGDIKLTYRKDANDPFECLPDGNCPDDKTLSHLGILSLTSKGNNHPMWGNYADKYRGACIEFKIQYFYIPPNKQPANKGEELALDSRIYKQMGTTALFFQYWEEGERKMIDQRGGDVLLKCEYSTKRSNPETMIPYSNHWEELAGFQTWYRQIITKHKDWEYEDEYRVTIRHNRCSRYSLGPPSMYFTNSFTRYITKIVLGPYCQYAPEEVAFLIARKRRAIEDDSYYIPKGVKIAKAKFPKDAFHLEIPDDNLWDEERPWIGTY